MIPSSRLYDAKSQNDKKNILNHIDEKLHNADYWD